MPQEPHAGIGGHGYTSRSSIGFGTIIIESGTVNAYGGATSSSSTAYPAGAGIGTGGMAQDILDAVSGDIIINGGTVYAEGGECLHSIDSGGGAGIGYGGWL